VEKHDNNHKWFIILIVSICLFVTVLIPKLGHAHIPNQQLNQPVSSLAPMIEGVKDSIVNILATSAGYPEIEENLIEENEPPKDPYGQTPRRRNKKPKNFESFGSGVIVNAKEGLIVTNFHLIEQTKLVTVTLTDGRHFKAKVVGTDPDSDVAILKIKADRLVQIPIGDSSKTKAGDFVIAIGNPYGLTQTVTSGIVSAVERNNLGIEGYEDFIQTDASINPGNSGGALVNMKGELVGINTAILAPGGGNVGIGFAIPSNMVMTLMQQIVKFGNVARGMVGIMIQNLTPELAKALNEPDAKGAVVTSVSPNSPAAVTGILPGDIILKINDKPIHSAGQVQNTLGLYRAGSKFTVQILRDNSKLTYKLVSADPEAYKHQSEINDPFLHGLIMKNFDAILPGIGYIQGVQILNISENSPAFQAGMRPGDVIVSINNKPSPDLLTAQKLAADNKQEEILLNVFRGNGAIYMVLHKIS